MTNSFSNIWFTLTQSWQSNLSFYSFVCITVFSRNIYFHLTLQNILRFSLICCKSFPRPQPMLLPSAYLLWDKFKLLLVVPALGSISPLLQCSPKCTQSIRGCTFALGGQSVTNNDWGGRWEIDNNGDSTYYVSIVCSQIKNGWRALSARISLLDTSRKLV